MIADGSHKNRTMTRAFRAGLSTASIAMLLAVAACSGFASAEGAENKHAAPAEEDAYLWLEQVDGARALSWVQTQDERTRRLITDTPEFRKLEQGIRAQLDSEDNIPSVGKMGDYYYNSLRDAEHPRGLWRRATPAEYRKAQPAWESVLDLDKLSAEEHRNWTGMSPSCLAPTSSGMPYRHCLITLSQGGGDASLTREYDLVERRWVKDGFSRPEEKGGISWIDADTVYLGANFGPGTLTRSGNPRVVKRWRRGTPVEQAETVFEGEAGDVSVKAWRDRTPGFERDFALRMLTGHAYELYLLKADGKPLHIDVPSSMEKTIAREWLLLNPQDDWKAGGKTYAAGSLLITKLDDFLAGKREFSVLFEPTATTSVAGITFTRHYAVVNTLDNIKNRLWVWTKGEKGWQRSAFVGAPDIGSVSVSAADGSASDEVWLTTQSFLSPRTLSLATIGRAPKVIKSQPAAFDASRHVMEQNFAVSKDGTRVPYFLVRAKNLKCNGANPVLMSGYGGFGTSLPPAYSPTLGLAWLERGGVYVVANGRGGGEYGPAWHQAAVKENRHKAYEDFAAVAQDLIARKITSPAHLGAIGKSNGGLLMGNMLTQYPQLFGAIVAEVPLLDMKRYSHLLAGASWLAEYGDPDTADWDFIRTFSPYQLFDPARKYPAALFITSTRDDRVHPGHARKMAAKMLDAGKDVVYYENREGGHGGAANNEQRAFLDALSYTFLWKRLTSAPGDEARAALAPP